MAQEINLEELLAKAHSKRNLSYRYYKHLSDKEKAALDRTELLPEIKLFVLKIHSNKEVNLKTAIKLAKKYYADYINWEHRKQPKVETNHEYIKKELEFRGFVPVSSYKMNENKYAYIITNKPIDGTYWVYPMEFESDYEQMLKGKKDINTLFPFIALVYHTRILYQYGYRS